MGERAIARRTIGRRARIAARAAVALLLLLAACGRVGFNATTGDGDARGADDARADVAVTDTQLVDATFPACAFDICDHFESLDTSLWTVQGNVVLDTTVARTGNASLRMHIDATPPNTTAFARIVETRTFETNPTTIFVRGWFRLSALPAGNNGMELIKYSQAEPSDIGNYLFVRATELEVFSQFDNSYAGTFQAPPTNTWWCATFRIVRSTGTGGVLTVTSDQAGGTTLTMIQTDDVPPLAEVGIGIYFASTNLNVTQPAFDLWVDDVLVDGSPLTCADN